MKQSGGPRIAIALGDPAGIGPEISLKAALDPAVTDLCRPVLVGDTAIIECHAQACGLAVQVRTLDEAERAGWSPGPVTVVPCQTTGGGALHFGTVSADWGRAALKSASTAIRAALAGTVDAVVAAPQTEKSIAAAGIEFDGYPSFVARETGTDPRDVFLMICFDQMRIVHGTLHVSVRGALELITRERVARVIRVTDSTLRRLGVTSPRLCVGGLNPHAGEEGLFGREEIEIIGPAIADAVQEGIAVTGPFGADTMFRKTGVDAFIVMLHDQGHIAAKLLAFNRTAGLSIGSPILFSSVAHGSAFDIAGKGIADPGAMISAVQRLAGISARGEGIAPRSR